MFRLSIFSGAACASFVVRLAALSLWSKQRRLRSGRAGFGFTIPTGDDGVTSRSFQLLTVLLCDERGVVLVTSRISTSCTEQISSHSPGCTFNYRCAATKIEFNLWFAANESGILDADRGLSVCPYTSVRSINYGYLLQHRCAWRRRDPTVNCLASVLCILNILTRVDSIGSSDHIMPLTVVQRDTVRYDSSNQLINC